MDIATLITIHEQFSRLGGCVFEQFVDVAEAGDAEGMNDLVDAGELNPNAAREIRSTLKQIISEIRGNDADDDLTEELTNLVTELDVFLKGDRS